MTIHCPHCNKDFNLELEKEERICKNCNSIYIPIREAQVFCGQSCRTRFHNKDRMRVYNEKKKAKLNDL